ncbi:phage tail protein [Paenibacillus sp. NPDC058177]|uniref:phage tail protein n=1 Tax=Paenibacillus sp. NPDC058177 TaxID=3346369 RepID=UPI0036D93F34
MRLLESFDKNLTRVGLLVDAYDIQRKRRINSDYEIQFLVPMTSEDYQEKLVIKGHIQDERGQYYVINSRSRVRDGKKLIASIVCTHVMFKLTDFKFPYTFYINESYGVHISQLTDLISTATGNRFKFIIDDSFDLHDVKDFGRGNCLQALNKIIEMYGCEIEPDNFVIHLKKKIGVDNGLQYRIKKNIVSDQFKDDASSLVTRLFAQMKDGTTWIGQPTSILTNEERTLLEAVPGAVVDGILKVNYLISPYASAWASDSVPFFDDEIILQDIDPSINEQRAVTDLVNATRKSLREREIPSFEVSVSGADLHKIDKEEPTPGLGDTVYCYDPKMEMNNLMARITELTEYPYTKEKHAQATISNVASRDYNDIIADLDKSKKLVDNLFSNGRVRTELFESVARQVIADINNSKTELIYPLEGGILAQDKVNPLRQVRLTSAGLGISTDGWHTLRAAVTADGVMGESIIGKIGNFESLSVGHDNEIILLNHTGFSAGHANFNDAPFRLDMNGNVVARKITLTGSVEQSDIVSSLIRASRVVGNEIEGGTITGALIRTAPDGQRVELDINSFRSVDSGGKTRVSISQSGKYGVAGTEYFDGAGIYKGGVYGIDDGFYIDAPSYMNLYAPVVAFNGNVRFDNAISVSGIRIESITGLQSALNGLGEGLTGKASKGAVTGSAGPYNCGIPIGTVLRDVDGKAYTWTGVPAHTHTQN